MRRSLAVAAVAAVAAAFVFAGRVLVVADPLPPSADAIVILAGSIADRTLEAADLYRAGVAPRVLVTRERLPRGEAALRARGIALPPADRQTIDVLEQLGVPPSAIRLLRRRNTSTESEARTIARDACTHRYRRLVVVTSRPHTRRARLILRRALGPRVAVAVRPSRYDPFSARRWWRVRRDAKLVLSEYQKLANFWLFEGWRIPPCGGLRASASSRR
ncbi:MAG TPA: YdcF family protein [Candidatus Binatia bacterium]|nr:YdcF family protein [Candidatus Binatia bacterium]